MEHFFRFIQHYIALNEALKSHLSSISQINTYSEKDWLLKPGRIARKVYFLLEGSIRTYYETSTKEITTWFYLDQYLVSAWGSFITQKPSIEYIEAMSECILIEIGYDDWQALYRKFPEFDRFGRLIAEEQLVVFEEISKGFMFMTAKQKYNLLLEYFPGITQKVNLGHIASFLGITQETLSRIRS